MSDELSGLLDQWGRERPDLDVTPMSVFARIARLHRAQLEASERADRLAGRGLVERLPNGTDRRSTTVGLTPAGRRLIDRALPLHLDAERALLRAVPEAEQRRLITLLAKAMRGVNEPDLP